MDQKINSDPTNFEGSILIVILGFEGNGLYAGISEFLNFCEENWWRRG